MGSTEQLTLVVQHEDEWPARVGKLIADLAEWYAAHPALADHAADDIAAFLLEIWEDALTKEGVVHLSCGLIFDRGTAGRAEHTVDTSVVIDDLRRTLALAAFERYALPDAA